MRLFLSALLLLVGCKRAIVSGLIPPPPGTPTLQSLGSFSGPVFVASPPADSARLFVVEKVGRIRVLRNDTLLAPAFLDIRTKISTQGERGLLSVAFHPQYATNGRFYVYFNNPAGDIRIVRYLVSPGDPNVADETVADTVLKVAHPTFDNHNGGQLQFGPDGMLYLATGDGGSGGDPSGNGQNRQALLGKLLRLNVDGTTGYTIPPDNPFVSDPSGADEIWAYGLRNPWRFSFDRFNGDLYIADVGQGAWEEVNVSATADGGGKGLNFGWNIMEGMHCYPPGTSCNTAGLTQPLVEYNHSNGACSVTGGYVYRSSRVPALFGQYLYADYCAAFVRSFAYSGGAATQPADWTMQLSPGGQISSFGEDARGDVYIMSLGGGLYRIVEAP
jgi:glucose/arabinose dehydrogenase